MWRAHAEAARVYIYVATVSAGSPGLESGADELESKEKYHEVIKQKHQLNYPNNIAHNNHVNLQQLWQCSWATEQVLEKRDYDKVGVLIVREQLGFEVRVKQSVSDPFLRYQIIDGERILLNIPEDSTALQSPLTYTPSERCVSIDDIHFTQQYVAEFRRQWKDAVTLAKFIERRIVLPLCSEPVVSEHVIHDIVKLTGLPVEVIRGAAKTLAKEGAFRLDSADHAS